MDTIIRGKPIPKLFMRQKLNAISKKSVREVVDGQQRLRTILSYLEDGFQISKRHNSQYGGMYFSQLAEVDPEIQANILNYEVAVDLLVNMPDSEVLDVFGRLNSYAVVLNDQERLNADHFGPFKLLADNVGHRYYDFWTRNKILTDMEVLRMGDASLVADLIIAMTDGIKSKNQVRKYYDLFERDFSFDQDELSTCFDNIIDIISAIFTDTLKTSEFHRISLFYSLFTSIYHARYGLRGLNLARPIIKAERYARIRTLLNEVDEIFGAENLRALTDKQRGFRDVSRRATTDASARLIRTEFIVNLLLKE